MENCATQYELLQIMQKVCKTCAVKKPISLFYKQGKGGGLGVRGSCKACDNVKKALYRTENRQELNAKNVVDYYKNQQLRLDQKRKYRQANKGKLVALNAARKAVIKQRTPAWLTDFDKLKIKCIYQIAAMLTRENNEPWHVDHIIPLQGKMVSGLHTPPNLRPMRGLENIGKKNKFEVAHA